MSNYRRVQLPGGVFFFTVVTHLRRRIFTSDEPINALRTAISTVRRERPFAIDAMVVLPDHLHCIWRLPEGDTDFSSRWREIKKAASRAIAPESGRSGQRTVWQKRFWEHAIRDEKDWRRHLDYIHFNPVKHGLADRPADWPWSSFNTCVARGWYEPGWGVAEPLTLQGLELE